LVQGNFTRQNDARLAAEAGMARALRAMNESSWAGVDTPVTGSLGTGVTYSVTYTTGDSSLTASDPQYAEWPFRVAVVQLIRKRLNTAPSGWSNWQTWTFVQWSSSRNAVIDVPLSVTGTALYFGVPTVFTNAPKTSGSRTRYATDLNAMRLAGLADQRPFTGSVTLPSSTAAADQTLLATNLATTTVLHNNSRSSGPVNHPGSVTSYRLYPGGTTYAIPDLRATYGSTVSGATLQAHPQTNPLGVFRATDEISLGTGTTLTGTVLNPTSKPVNVTGTGVVVQGRNLPLLQGSTTNYQIPSMIVNDEINVRSGATCNLRGLIMAWDQFDVDSRTATTSVAVTGRIMAADIDLRGITTWQQDSTWWGARLTEFLAQVPANPPTAENLYFPVWLRTNHGFNPQPTLTIQPDSSGVQYHWHDWSQPVFIADATDGALRWNLISWQSGT
jgi:hypothetical protein